MRALIPAVLILALTLTLPATRSFAAPMPSGSYQTAALAGYRVKTAHTSHARQQRAAKKHRAEMRKKARQAQLRKKAIRQQQRQHRRMIRAKQSRRVLIRRGALRTTPGCGTTFA